MWILNGSKTVDSNSVSRRQLYSSLLWQRRTVAQQQWNTEQLQIFPSGGGRDQNTTLLWSSWKKFYHKFSMKHQRDLVLICVFVCRSVVSAEFGARVHCSISRILQTAALPVEPRPDTGNTQEADQKPAGLSPRQKRPETELSVHLQ